MALQGQKYFIETPFAAMANPQTARFWADRHDALERLGNLSRSYASRADSSLDLIWANLGAGKTHALLHLKYLLAKRQSNTIAVYFELPDQPKKFLDLYHRIVPELVLAERVSLLPENLPRVMPDVLKAIRMCKHGTGQHAEIAVDWLIGGRPQLRELKALVGIGARIEDDSRACDVLTALLSLYASAGHRVVLLIDEFQRIAAAKSANRISILANLRSIFSSNTMLFSAVLAATSLIEKSAIELLSPELRTLMGPKPMISLPEMSKEEAYEFLVERLTLFRPRGYGGDSCDPFGDEGIRNIVDAVASSDDQRLIPRTLLQLAGIVYDEIAAGDAKAVTRKFVLGLLSKGTDVIT